MSRLSPLLKTGNVAFCPIDSPDPCEIVSTGHSYPNGLIHSRLDDRIYLPSSAAGGVKVLTTYTNNSVELLHEIDVPYAIDNLSEDRNGDIWVAVITKGIDFIRSAKSPFTIFPPSSVFKIQRTGSETYTVTKVLEDRDGEALPGTTTVIHDATTGKLFLGGKKTVRNRVVGVLLLNISRNFLSLHHGMPAELIRWTVFAEVQLSWLAALHTMHVSSQATGHLDHY